ncbi:MAG: tRNA (adenine57-N1/adenine58-N1)-methyltransferase [Myxococcota bacterium]|jgi:tRNA (adenine57-N1/adenine58-N1)-methyltransferase
MTDQALWCFRPGQPVILLGRKHREFYTVLAEGGKTSVRGRIVQHDDIIGQPQGCRVRALSGDQFEVIAATLQKHALHMPRHAQIIYPKDIAMLLLHGDVYPGLSVIEGGFGSGALSTGILRAIGDSGRLTTYELRPEPVIRAQRNVETLLGPRPNHTVRIDNIYDGIEECGVDRVILDVPEPWQVIEPAAKALRPGGIFAAYVPTAIQLHRLGIALQRSWAFTAVESQETLVRPWFVNAKSCRPEQRMIGHTGFLMFAHRRAVRTRPMRRALAEDAVGDEGRDKDRGRNTEE